MQAVAPSITHEGAMRAMDVRSSTENTDAEGHVACEKELLLDIRTPKDSPDALNFCKRCRGGHRQDIETGILPEGCCGDLSQGDGRPGEEGQGGEVVADPFADHERRNGFTATFRTMSLWWLTNPAGGGLP